MAFDLDDVWGDSVDVLKSVPRQNRRRIYRISMVGVTGASYLLDTMLLTAFYYTGTIQFEAPLFYGLAALAHVMLFSILHWTGFSERFKNPHMTIWQMAYAICIQVIAMTYAHEVAPYFLGLILVIFAFAALRISLREAIFSWLFVSIAMWVTLHYNPNIGFELPNASSAESLLVAVCFSVTLLRVIALGYYAAAVQLRMYDMTRSFKDDAVHDDLTGTLNRRGLHDILEEQFSLLSHKSLPCAIAMIDIDHFKHINDDFGHDVGDEILKAIVQQIRLKIRNSDQLIRFGGEEFILVMPVTNLLDGELLVERLRIHIGQQQWNELPDKRAVNISIGLTELTNQDNVGILIKRADAALYEAKHTGRNRVVVKGTVSTDQVCNPNYSMPKKSSPSSQIQKTSQ